MAYSIFKKTTSTVW